MIYNKSELAKKTGISRQSIINILSGKQKNPRIQTLEKIAEILGIDVITLRNKINDCTVDDLLK